MAEAAQVRAESLQIDAAHEPRIMDCAAPARAFLARASQTSCGFQFHGRSTPILRATAVRSARAPSAVALKVSVQLIGMCFMLPASCMVTVW